MYSSFDAVWTGEASDYAGACFSLTIVERNATGGDAAHYLVAIAGVPFGLPAQMLSGAATKKDTRLYYRALLFGMTERAGWQDAEKSLARVEGLWRLFDAFGVEEAEVFGFWRAERGPVGVEACPGVRSRAVDVSSSRNDRPASTRVEKRPRRSSARSSRGREWALSWCWPPGRRGRAP